MYIVELALRRPYTFVVMAIAITMFGLISIVRMNVDIFPFVNIPIVSCIFTYSGMSASEMENLVTTVVERAITSTVSGIKRLESSSLSNMSIIKVYLQEGTNIGQSVAMVTSVGTALLRQLPRGISAPFVVSSSATDVPVVQLVLTSDSLSESQLFDIANNLIRNQLATVQGAIIPFPYGGKFRQVCVDLDLAAIRSLDMSATEVVEALDNQNVINPTGTAKMGSLEYIITLNNVVKSISELNAIPIKSYKDSVIFLRDVAHVHDGNQPQINIINYNGRHAVMLNIIKNGKASTLKVVQGVKSVMPRIGALIPAGCNIKLVHDQSLFVQECVQEVAREAATAAALTALMMLALLGSWRSTLIVAVSIPLAILAAIIGLNVLGQTINSMTLGGLALAVGMLVDDATVEVENVHRNLSLGKNIETAIMDGAQQVALPALVSTLSICIVFVPVVLLTEPSKSLFAPLGLAVALAMLASYGLSRTVVPVMSCFLFKGSEDHGEAAHEGSSTSSSSNKVKGRSFNLFSKNLFSKLHEGIEAAFEKARQLHAKSLSMVLDSPTITIATFTVVYALSFCLVPFLGADYFPRIDGGEVRLHVDAPSGTRIEETDRLFRRIERSIQALMPADQIEVISDNIGLPIHGINYAYSDSRTQSAADGEILVSLNEHRPHPTWHYESMIRKMMKEQFPEYSFFFQPADIVTQILVAGLPAPIDVKIMGWARPENYHWANVLKEKIRRIKGVSDVLVQQSIDAPHILWDINRPRAQTMGLTQGDIADSYNFNLSSSFQVKPNFWLNTKNGINYDLASQTPQRRLSTLQDVGLMTITGKPSMISEQKPATEYLTNLGTAKRDRWPVSVNHFSVQPVFDVCAACDGRDLGNVFRDVQKAASEIKKELPRTSFMIVAGQGLSMIAAFIALIGGLVFALVLVYLLLAVNFQSWTDPLIILVAVPGALAGIVWALFVTQTTISIPALMGAIMTIGVASSNSILMITFANEQLSEGFDARTAAMRAGFERFRPVIMTATAMIIGMIPMAIGSGQGGSQNAPIGRAVIGGLMFATFSTLLLVPLVFSLTHRRKNQPGTRSQLNAGAPGQRPGERTDERRTSA
jgi:multidrug efflux pump subunit AcrB